MTDQFTNWEREVPCDETVLIRYLFKDFIEYVYPFYVDEVGCIYMANEPFGSGDVPPVYAEFFEREDVQITGWMSLPDPRTNREEGGR